MADPRDIYGGFLLFHEEMQRLNLWPVMQQTWANRQLESRVEKPWEKSSASKPFRPGGSSPPLRPIEEDKSRPESDKDTPVPKRVFRPGSKS